MKPVAHAFAVLAIAASPAFSEGQDGSADEGFNLIEEGAKIILRSMIDQVEPALKDLHSEFGQAFREMEPALKELAQMLGDIRNYEAPEMLPNGDIIIRRKTPAQLAAPDPGGDIEI